MLGQISRDEIRSAIEDKLCARFGVTAENATEEHVLAASAIVIREIMSRFLAIDDPKNSEIEVHYLSMEFLIGRSLMKNAYNLGITAELTGAIEDLGFNASDVFECEPDAGLGNGGLGRLAACYMDSMASEGLAATGYSICYELGIFKQKFENGGQTELADNWQLAADNWLLPHYTEQVEVRFGGTITPTWENGKYKAIHTGYESVIAVPRDMLVAGYGLNRINTLRLWEAKSPKSLDMYLFSAGKYVSSMENRTMAEVITKILYPADDHVEGKILRLKQQYFWVSASAQDIVRKHLKTWGDIRTFGKHQRIQINDTHATVIIPELMRIFMDDYNLGWDEAWEIIRECVAYTNHTIMSEALEKWPQELISKLMPRVWEIICEINKRWSVQLVGMFGANDPRVSRNLIINNGQVHMANMDLSACYRVNGVSRLHGDILKDDLFADLNAVDPYKFTYVTNGIDHRRWLSQINPGLDAVVKELVGENYVKQPELLAGLEQYASDSEVRNRINAIKYENKLRFAEFAKRNDNFIFNPDAIMDVQVKRLHEYKRQLLCAMSITSMQMQLHDNPNMEFAPRTFVFGAKSAAGYKTAKRIIELLLSLADDVNNDPVCKGRLQVLFVENYRVSAAEAIVPAAQVSEQISTAGKEASGTGCMKLMMNGAVTIGTLDGANVEMYDFLGDDNMFLFGLHTPEVAALKANGYNPANYANADGEINRIMTKFSRGFRDGKTYSDLVSNLLYNGDQYMLIADYRSYADTQKRMYSRIANPDEYARMAIINTAKSGFFAADRAIDEYARNIWHVK